MRRALLAGWIVLVAIAALPSARAQEAAFQLAPAVAAEAEDFQVEKGWKVVQAGQGNYMVDIIGFCHTSGEKLLCIDGQDTTAAAWLDVNVPASGTHRLWVRYEYPAFCETRFSVVVEQGGRTLLDQVLGTKESPRYAFADPTAKAQHDPSWGPEGIMEEVATVPGLQAGPARIWLKGAEQPQTPGVAAGRHIDLVYLTSDAEDKWLAYYRPRTNLYPLLDAFRDSRGPRYEVRFTNRGSQPSTFTINHTYNRLPWYLNEGAVAVDIPAGSATDWIGLKLQDTCHYHLMTFASSGEAFDIQVRPTGGAVEREAAGAASYLFYLPPYAGKGDSIVTPIEKIDAILKLLAETPKVGRNPTLPLCYGGWMPLGQDNEYGRKYAQLYAAIGMRSLHPANGVPKQLENLQAAGVPPSKSWMIMGYRNPPLAANIAAAKQQLAENGLGPHLQWYDYGDEIGFSEWMGLVIQDEVTRTAAKAEEVAPRLWREWLAAKRPGFNPRDYWLDAWGALDPAQLRPDSSSATAAVNPRLYVDSVIFYEETAISLVAERAKAVRAELGEHVLCGANYSCHPFYYPVSTMYIKWFRGGAAEMGRHSEYFWQVAQPGPMINGYIAEHFRCGMRNNPRAVLRQYTMPHSPGNTEGDFLRSAFSHLAHGAKMLDFFGIGLNETFTENHIDHRDHQRYRAIRDVTHPVGLVEDLLPDSTAVPTGTAILVSESTERWDFAGVATDLAGHAHFGPDFRKTRLFHHLERLGIWKGLTFLGASPDLIIEEDLNPDVLRGYKLVVIVGDCLPLAAAPALEQWVQGGGVLLVTAGAGRFDPYPQPITAFDGLFGLKSRTTDDRTAFVRPRQELPFLQPISQISGLASEKMPVIATHERIQPADDAKPLAQFDDGSPAVIVRQAGQGQVIYAAAHPGLAYLWTALQPPAVPDRGPGTHTIPTDFDPAARALLAAALEAAAVNPVIQADPPLVDCRLLRSPRGYVLPIANYNKGIGQSVTLTIKVDGPISRVTSAYHGELPVSQEESGGILVSLPALDYGDMLRLDP